MQKTLVIMTESKVLHWAEFHEWYWGTCERNGEQKKGFPAPDIGEGTDKWSAEK